MKKSPHDCLFLNISMLFLSHHFTCVLNHPHQHYSIFSIDVSNPSKLVPIGYCCRSGSGPPWLVSHSALFCWMKALSSEILCSMDASMVDKYPLKSWTKGMWWPFPKICLIIKINPKMAVSLFTPMCRFESLLGSKILKIFLKLHQVYKST